jgi:hypothetical protein
MASHRHDATEGTTMNWTTNRYRVNRDNGWISSQQAFVCTCWSVFFALCAIYEAVGTLFG